MKTAAVFDIGSNTVLVTVGTLLDTGAVKILLDEGDVVRLSEGLLDGAPLRDDAKLRVLNALRGFKSEAEKLGAREFLAAGTAAFRRASDGAEFAERIESELGIPVKILTGDEEAHYSFESARADFESKFGPIGMIDIGGGSTEFVFGANGPRTSLPIGTVRLTEKFITRHPIPDAEWQQVSGEIQSQLSALRSLETKPSMASTWVAVAATPASLAAVLLALPVYDPEKVHGYILEIDALEKLNESLRNKSLEERTAMPGMHPKRAELLPVGGLILEEAMKFLSLNQIVVSDHGLRYGLLHRLLKA